jgi:hypothetical protein
VFDEETLRSAAEIPGYCGPLADERPTINLAILRPFVWSILLWFGGVRTHEIASCVCHLANTDDLKCSESDLTPLEEMVLAVMNEFIQRETVRLNDEGVYVLNVPACLSQATSVVCLLDAQLPPHLLNDLAKHHLPHGKHGTATDATAPNASFEEKD